MKQSHRLLSKKQDKKIGVFLFNHVWDLMEKKNRTREEDAEMIRDVQAMGFHWREAGTPKNFAVSEWQIARVYSLLGMSESALFHAKRSLSIVKAGDKDFEDFHLPSAYEGLARAYASAGDARNAKRYARLAEQFARKIKSPEDRNTIMTQIQSIHIPSKNSRKRAS